MHEDYWSCYAWLLRRICICIFLLWGWGCGLSIDLRNLLRIDCLVLNEKSGRVTCLVCKWFSLSMLDILLAHCSREWTMSFLYHFNLTPRRRGTARPAWYHSHSLKASSTVYHMFAYGLFERSIMASQGRSDMIVSCALKWSNGHTFQP
ncbi:hypothetical protein BDZ45DRAFT_233797 [Acephala macrosclerotiorum]|nr:hypothetical protein BDZ45DRAFT_233797 [Acephala macrosclerotiorum]